MDMKGPQDMQQQNSTKINIGFWNYKGLSQNKIELEQQGIYDIINSDKLNFQVIQVKMIGYQIDINIHDICLKKQKMKIVYNFINQAYKQIYLRNNKNLKYQHTILMNHHQISNLNDLIVIDDNIQQQQNVYTPDPIEQMSSISNFMIFQLKLFKAKNNMRIFKRNCIQQFQHKMICKL
ncbi:unnamed protein product [Paramecium pentaurelia]|uniref:Uncharacterized protein n=1 Tax=Paramecium pentaurelia TaxID=43138 RepID=A0A8S1TG59_9CILI|nr:unnamed protein product [Paramecium pentaurelia]